MNDLKPSPLPERIPAARITLTKHSLEIAEQMFRAVDADRDRLGRFLPWVDKIMNVQEERDYIKMTHELWSKLEQFDFSIFRNEDGAYLGNIGAHSIAWNHQRAEIGYWIAGSYEGKGYISEAVQALEAALFRIGFNRIEICCSSLNERSASVPRRCGYHLDGVLRQDSIEKGQFRDTMVFSKLRADLT